MGHENTVIHSVNLHGEMICVDIFRRPDGSFGFDEFRRDVEDGRGWFSIGNYSARRFCSSQSAIAAAIVQIGWFDGI